MFLRVNDIIRQLTIKINNRSHLFTKNILSNHLCLHLRGKCCRIGFLGAAVNHHGIRAKNCKRVARFCSYFFFHLRLRRVIP